LTAQVALLPGEDEAAFRRRVDSFVEAMAPRDAVELAIAEQAALSTWEIERAERAEAARVAAALRAAEATVDLPAQDEVAAMGHWLTTTAPRPRQDAGKSLFPFLSEDRHDPFGRGRGEPRHIVLRLEATAGCRWLLEQWARLARLLERGYDWRTNELILALLLRGQRPMGLDVLDWQGVLEPIPADGNHEAVAVARCGMLIQFAGGLPADPAERRAALLGLVHEEVACLEQREADHERRAAADRAALAARLSVGTTAEGERMRRYQLDFDRKLHRALNGLLKLRRAEDRGVAGDPAPDDDPAPDPAPEPAGTVGPAGGPAAAPEGDADAAVRPETEGDSPASLHSASSLPPSALPEPARPVDEPEGHRIPRNEPRSPAADDPLPQNELSPPAAIPSHNTDPPGRGGSPIGESPPSLVPWRSCWPPDYPRRSPARSACRPLPQKTNPTRPPPAPMVTGRADSTSAYVRPTPELSGRTIHAPPIVPRHPPFRHPLCGSLEVTLITQVAGYTTPLTKSVGPSSPTGLKRRAGPRDAREDLLRRGHMSSSYPAM
jgi:hypothetical protein